MKLANNVAPSTDDGWELLARKVINHVSYDIYIKRLPNGGYEIQKVYA